jgi:tetratricopeptide (TPR) repeat protein
MFHSGFCAVIDRAYSPRSFTDLSRQSRMGRIRHFIIGVCILTTAVHSQTTLDAGLVELNRGNIFEAIRIFKQIVRAEPSSPGASFYLSGIYTGMGRYGTAYGYLNASMKDNPGQGAYYYQLGVIRRYEGCGPEALAAFQQALKAGMGKGEAAAWRQIGDVQEDLLDWDKALDAYRNVLSFQPDDAGAHLALGRLYLNRNDPQRAVSELRAALGSASAPDGVHSSLGRAYRALGDLDSSVSILQKGVERNPADEESLYMLGQVLLALGRESEGRRVMGEYQSLQERLSRTNSLFESAIERAQSGELDRAEALLKEVLRIAPRYAPALQALGTVQLNRGNTQGALEMLKQAQASNPLNSETYFEMGTAYLRSGKFSEALDMSLRALILDEEDPRYQSLSGEIYSKMNRPVESRAAFELGRELQSRPGYRPADPYGSEMRHRDDSETVKAICGHDADK